MLLGPYNLRMSGNTGQTARADSGSTIVQIQGDGNTVIAGTPYLELTRRTGLSRRIGNDPDTGRPNEIEVIGPFARSIDLIGRETELSDLRDWLHNGEPVSVRVLTGGAGLGKTRLALELVEEMAADGWRAGFLTREGLARFREQTNLAAWDWSTRVLAVVDYASASARDLNAWLKELADHPVWSQDDAGRNRPLRLLLLERHATHGDGWWAEAFGRGNDAVTVEKMLDPLRPVALHPLDDPSHRRAILTRTLARLGSDLTLPEDADFDRRLAELTWGGVPLLLMMAAVTAARTDFGHVLALGTDTLALNIAETELSRIRKVVAGHGVTEGLGPLIDHVVAVATLRQGLTREAARLVLEEEAVKLGYALPAGPAALRDVIATALPDGGGVAPVEPDMIGEAVLLSVWEGKTDALPAIVRAHEAEPVATMETVIRTCQDYAIHGHRQPMDWLKRIFDARTDLSTLIELSAAMPRHTVELREIAVEIAHAVAELIEPLVHETREENHLALLAVSLNHMSNRLSDVERRGDALAVAEEAVKIYRDLEVARPDAFLPSLAGTLNNLSACLSKVGRREDALATAEEATTVYRDLAAAYPETFRPGLAMSLNNLSICLSKMLRHEDALSGNEEALTIYRGLAATRSDTFLPDLAKSLSNLSNRLLAVERQQDALATAEEAVKIYRGLVATRPDAFLPDLAESLNNLSACLWKVGRSEEALATVKEAVMIYRDLAATRSDSFLPYLATSLSNQSVCLSEVGHLEEALAAVEEAVTVYRFLAETRPDAFLPYLAASLNNLFTYLSKAGRHEDALATAREAVIVRHGLATVSPHIFLPDLAKSLSNLSRLLLKDGRREGVLPTVEEAVKLLKQTFLGRPAGFAQEMEWMIHDYRKRYEEVGQEPDAALLALVEEAFQCLACEEGEANG